MRTPSMTLRATFVLAMLVSLASLVPRTARAADPFEIQVYDGSRNDQGVVGLELHLNRVMSGHEKGEPPQLSLHGQSHATFEPSFGLTDWWELGGYFQTTLRDDGHLDYAGVKLRSKFTTREKLHDRWRLGVNFEFAVLPEAYDRDRFSAEIRPIASWSDEVWLFAFNPIFGLPLAGDGLRAGPTFEPAFKLSRTLGDRLAIGVEYYGDVGAIRQPSGWAEQAHVLYEVVDLLNLGNLELNLGVGEGLTSASKGVVIKAIVGWAFEGPSPPRHASARGVRIR